MITAKDARKQVEEGISENSKIQLEKIEKHIIASIKKEALAFNFYEAIRPNVKRVLEENGYKIEFMSGNGRMGESYSKISW